MNTTLPQWCADDTPLVCGAQSWCEHEATRIVMEPPNSVHHAREICENCGRVLRWLPKPATIQQQQLNSYRIAKLALSQSLSSWERRFVQSLLLLRRLSPKQQGKLDELCDKFQIG